jgi:hypothetical protein
VLTGILLVMLAMAIAAAVVSDRRRDRAERDRHAQLKEQASEQLRRIRHLELTLDEVRARELSTSTPAPVVATPEQAPLPPEIRAELEEIEGDEERAEIEERARFELANGADPKAVAQHLFD